MKNVVQDIVAKGSLESFGSLLLEWTHVLEKFVEVWRQEDDVPWWYNERASVSVFAAAIWKSKGMAFEEFSSKKHRRRKKSTYAGKVDLRFRYREEDFIAEAKQIWPAIGPQAHSQKKKMKECFRRATKDVLRAPDDEGRRLAIVFASPSFPMTLKDYDRRLDRWKDDFGQVEAEAKAFFWVRDCEWIVDRKEGYVYPGAGIFIREIASD